MKKIKIKDWIIILFLIIISCLVYLNELVPEEYEWKFLLFEFKAYHENDLNFVSWVLFSKISLVFLLMLWMLTSQYWWRYCIIIPIIVEFYKILGLLNKNLSYWDEGDYIKSLPITIPILLLLIFFARKINYFNKSQQSIINLNNEIDRVINNISRNKRKTISDVDKEVRNLKENKDNYSNEDYIKRLLKLRDSLINS